MKKLALLCMLISFTGVAQNAEGLQQLYTQFKRQEQQDSAQIARLIAQKRILQHTTIDGSGTAQLISFLPNGHAIFFATDNANAAATVGVDLIVSGATNGYGLTGGGIVLGEWDGGEVRTSHQEYVGRVTQVDNPPSLSDHATHVCGTMIASGINAAAKGMAYAATVQAHSFSNDLSEMTTFAGNANILSNHSYGTITGWRNMGSGNWRWYGDTTASGTEDINFGRYTTRARQWDLLANNAPQYLMVKSAGNDRNDNPPASVTSHDVWDNWTGGWITSTTSRPGDGGAQGYDCVSSYGNAKNILTVGAVNDIANGYAQPTDVVMSSFSGWGPTDDGRIKPDIVANGVSLFSTGSQSNTDYYSSSGTSMSAPNATGTLGLLQEMYSDSNGSFMLASTLKALVIHTANEAGGNVGPDYSFGWGLLNAKGAADVIANQINHKIIEDTLSNTNSITYSFYADGTQDVEATIVWNDPAGTVPGYTIDNNTIMLVNDLDLRISNASGTTKLPWTLNPAIPAAAAVKADNIRDNVEKVVFDSPTPGMHTFTITHKGTLANNQVVSLIISGITTPPNTPAPVVAFSGTPTTICEGQSVQFSHSTSNNPTLLEWTFPGGSPATASGNNPMVTYASAGTYSVKLKASNLGGADSLEIVNYITVSAGPTITHSVLPSLCIVDPPYTLTGGTPNTGTYSGTGVNNGVFDPQIAGIGNHPIYYTVTNGNGCSRTDTLNMFVSSPVAYQISDTAFCQGTPAFSLTTGSPLGGQYYGIGVSNGMFDPTGLTPGNYTVYYGDSTSNCALTDSATFSITTNVSASLSAFSSICSNVAPYTLTGGTPSGGIYYGPGVSNNIFDPSIAGIGTHTISYVITSGTCTDTASATISVTNGVVEITNIQPVYCTNDTAVQLFGSPIGGTFSGVGLTGSIFVPPSLNPGTTQITYTTTGGQCPGSITYDVTIAGPPSISAIQGPTISSNNTLASYFVPAQNGATYQWSAVNGTINTWANNQASVLWGNAPTGFLTAIMINTMGCKDSTNISVQLWKVGMIDLNYIQNVEAYPNPMGNQLTVHAEVQTPGVYEISLTNILGQSMVVREVSTVQSYISTQINTEMLASGQYVLHIKKENKIIATGKLIKP